MHHRWGTSPLAITLILKHYGHNIYFLILQPITAYTLAPLDVPQQLLWERIVTCFNQGSK